MRILRGKVCQFECRSYVDRFGFQSLRSARLQAVAQIRWPDEAPRTRRRKADPAFTADDDLSTLQRCAELDPENSCAVTVDDVPLKTADAHLIDRFLDVG